MRDEGASAAEISKETLISISLKSERWLEVSWGSRESGTFPI
jgi:hypothetical protein